MVDILIILILVLFNAFFSLSEVALISARKARIKLVAQKGSVTAQMALGLMNDPDKFLSTAQIGITVVSILTGIYSGAALSDEFARFLESFGLLASTASMLAKGIILVIATYLQCELGELFPKRIGIDLAEKMAKLCAPPMLFLATIAKPFVWFLSVNTDLLVRLFRLHKEDQSVTEEEIKSVIQEGTDSGEVKPVEQDIMERALVLGDQTVGHLMTHHTELVVLDVSMKWEEVEKVIFQFPFRGYPVIDGQIDNIVGYASLKSIIQNKSTATVFNLRSCTQAPLYFPEHLTVYKSLDYMRSHCVRTAFVSDEQGAFLGIITLHDIFEGLVGTFPDPAEMPDVIERNDHKSWIVSGQCLFYDFLEYFDATHLYADTSWNTLSGLILYILDHIPTVGEQCRWNDFTLKVVEMDGNRIHKVLVTRIIPTH